ncbi:hypothetical protein QYE76_048178 [Lolium multiflorum]|uniref:USP domain-containing protein n=1 Tax=Lolium multiflorum TaxID=4521 RepID=A0AAD8VCJ1_LOLMU|nr:hypothetical protein QYE76_048178 [Lolium multiflorum]
MANTIHKLALEALEIHNAGHHDLALACANELAAANPRSALALNLAGTLHVRASAVPWNEMATTVSASSSASDHYRAALAAFSAAARVAPNCPATATAHAEALAANRRLSDAQAELFRVFNPGTIHADPADHHVEVGGGHNPRARTRDALGKAGAVLFQVTAIIDNIIVPRESRELLLLGGDAPAPAADQVRARAKRLAERFPYSARARLLRVYLELEGVPALALAADRRRLLRRALAQASEAAAHFADSILIALFHAKVLFALDELDGSERECRRALRIQELTDPYSEDIPPAVSVPGADCDARVSSVRKQLRVLLKQIVVAAAVCWCSIKATQHRDMADRARSGRVDRVLSVRVDTLQGHYDGIDKSAAKTISDALRFRKQQGSWSFLVCPNHRCDGKKFVNTQSLWQHMSSKHRDELWKKLQSVLGPDLYEDTPKHDHLLDGITLSQDSDQHDIFHLPRVQDIFESLLLSPSIGIQAEPLAEMRQRKSREGAKILEDIKEELRMLPEDSTEFEEFRFAIQSLWLEFLETSALDYREIILPLARSFQWIQMKTVIDLSAKDLGTIIGCASIDIVFGKVPVAPGRIVSVEHGSEPSHANNTDHQSGDDTQTENIQPSWSDETLKDGEKSEESEVRIVDSNSETTVDQRSSDPTLDVHESGLNSAARIAEVELENKDTSYNLLDNTGTSGQSFKEMASTSSCQRSHNDFNKNNADKGLPILSLIIRSLCNLRHFRDKFLTEPLAWIPSAENICIAQQLYEIFISWEKNDYHLEDVVLTYMKTLLCRVDCTLFSEKVGTNFASEIVATILIGLHMSETCSRFNLRKETKKHVVNPITCGDCICPTHNLFGITFNVQMSCKCGECSGEYPYSALFHILDAGSLQTTKIKSFAELPVLLDEQFYKENSCEHCGIPQKIDLFLSNTPHFFTIALKWLGNSESPDTLSEVLADITSPLDIEFFCKSAHSGTMYSVTSMICYVDERYVCFARDKDRWLIHDFETVETEDTWEHLLERFRDCELQPEVLFFEKRRK